LTQKSLFEGRLVASCPSTGVSNPDFIKLAKAYGLPTVRIRRNSELKAKVGKVMRHKGPIVCELVVSPEMVFSPKASSKQLADGSFVSRPLEDMAPFLSEKELKENMYIPLWQE
jgi:acetolactate synthase-1/2/3 large subunit